MAKHHVCPKPPNKPGEVETSAKCVLIIQSQGPSSFICIPSHSGWDFCLLSSDCILSVRCGYFRIRSYSLMHRFYFKIHLYTSILSIKAFQKSSWNFSLNCLVSKILSEKLSSGHYQVYNELEVEFLCLRKHFTSRILHLCHILFLCSFLRNWKSSCDILH